MSALAQIRDIVLNSQAHRDKRSSSSIISYDKLHTTPKLATIKVKAKSNRGASKEVAVNDTTPNEQKNIISRKVSFNQISSTTSSVPFTSPRKSYHPIVPQPTVPGKDG
jgi:hypothetical protein